MARKAPSTKKDARQILAVKKKIEKTTDALKVLQEKLAAFEEASQAEEGKAAEAAAA